MVTSRHVGSVDLLKFILAVVIVILHCGKVWGGNSYLLSMGGIAVEAFFVISGYLMCVSAERDEASGTPIETDTIRFLGKKVRGFLVPYCVTVVLYLICWYAETGAALLKSGGTAQFLLKILSFVPNILLTSMAGILQDRALMDLTWYLSAMLIVMLVTYPLLRRFRRRYTLIAAPFLALLLMGYMYNMGAGYKGIKTFVTFMPQGLMRAFIAINLGCVAREIARFLQKWDLTRLSRILLTIVCAVLIGAMFLVMQCGSSGDCYALVLTYPILIGVLFSGQMAGDGLLSNRVTAWLGKGSIYLYLYHTGIRRILIVSGVSWDYGTALLIMLGGSMALFVLTELAGYAWRRLSVRLHRPVRSLFVR